MKHAWTYYIATTRVDLLHRYYTRGPTTSLLHAWTYYIATTRVDLLQHYEARVDLLQRYEARVDLLQHYEARVDLLHRPKISAGAIITNHTDQLEHVIFHAPIVGAECPSR